MVVARCGDDIKSCGGGGWSLGGCEMVVRICSAGAITLCAVITHHAYRCSSEEVICVLLKHCAVEDGDFDGRLTFHVFLVSLQSKPTICAARVFEKRPFAPIKSPGRGGVVENKRVAEVVVCAFWE